MENKEDRSDGIGGDDVLLGHWDRAGASALDIASNGDIYLVHHVSVSGGRTWLDIRKSTDGGNHFSLWGTIGGAPNASYGDPDLKIVEGNVSVCLLAYYVIEDGAVGGDIRLVSSPLGELAAFGPEVTVMADPGIHFHEPRFDTDVTSYSTFFIYLVASGSLSGGQDIWFARSTNQGSSFESPYKIAELIPEDRSYNDPDISYGYGGHLHVTWAFEIHDGSNDQSIRYRRASSFANGGLSSWNYWEVLTSGTDGYDDIRPVVHGGEASNDVVIAYIRSDAEENYVVDTRVQVSDDTGLTFDSSAEIPVSMGWPGDMVEDRDSGTWYLGYLGFGQYGLTTASISDLTQWSTAQEFNDVSGSSYFWYRPGIALDPSHENRPAMTWARAFFEADDFIYFDGAWRSDPGYPNIQPGFPLGLWAAPISPPAVVDVDGNGDLEIVFSDQLRKIQVINHDGTSLPGWPVDVGVNLSDGPVAVGDLNGDGVPILVVGGTDGNAYAYDHQGNLLPGWPSAITPPGNDIYVSIGAVGPPYHRSIVCAGANYVTLRNRRGGPPPGAVGWSVGSSSYTSPAAIGDLDDDGVAEIVCGHGNNVHAFRMGEFTQVFSIVLPHSISDALTLADLDRDGDLEILCPTTAGILYVLDHDGNFLGGNFPYDTGEVGPLTSAVMANFRGGFEPEIVFAHRDFKIHALYDDGSPVSGYPKNTSSGWFLPGAPIIGRVNGTSSDVVIGDRGDQAWAWTNVGIPIEGWPRDLQGKVNLSPAMGDLDQDGFNELVFLTDTQLFLIDLNIGLGISGRTWAMYGHDPRRSGCSDCSENMVSAVDPDSLGTLTRISFAGPSPNPVTGTTQFSFDVPRRAVVDLEIIDLRGRRVQTLHREEMEPGSRVVTWQGRDATGRLVASGQYFARLRVKGPGVDGEVIRKLTVVR